MTTNGFDLLLNGNRMVIKGMNYSPVPIGTAPGNPPYGDYFVEGYANVWTVDLENMRAAGVNAIKLYAGNPALNAGLPGSGGNWAAFLNACYNGGTNPIYVVMFSYVQGEVIAAGGDAYNQYVSDYQAMVSSTVTHPAVLGYCVGNEIFGGTVTTDTNFWVNFGKLLNAAKAAGQSQGVTPFLMTATNDNYTPQNTWPAIQLGENSGQLGNLDAWGINVYRGPLFGGAGNSVFLQYQQLMTSLNKTKPLILGEWGTPHSTRTADVYGNVGTGGPAINLDDIPQSEMGEGEPYFDATTTSQFLTTQWQTMKANIGAGTNQVCVGGFIFEWCDEYWKGNDNSNHLGGPNPAFQGGAFAGGYEDEAWYGITSAVDQSLYGGSTPINRTLFNAYAAVQAFYTSTTHLGTPLYGHPIFGAPNRDNPPVINIEWPTRKLIVTKEETVVIRGTASGGGGIEQILVRGPRETFQLATGTTDWSSQEDLRLGSNRFTIKAVGATGDTTTKFITIVRIPDHRHGKKDKHKYDRWER